MHDALLDNPIWSALTTTHARFAPGDDAVKRYPRDIGPFIAVARDTAILPPQALALAQPGEELNLVGHVPRLDAAWRTLHDESLLQMVHTGPVADACDAAGIVELGDAHAEAMLALTALVYPGYFRPRTRILGRYYGVLDRGQLAAMAGERMAVTGCTELSAVCTHPDYLGRGLAHRLVGHVVHAIRQRGLQPYLHVSSRNARAIRVYEASGFVVRCELPLRCVQRNG
ncbi:MAG TPA: GNAT family N-acetyltransferase [Pseudomonadota bacterium]|nr:GNAT family N-acetyltransferase [Pseudomonadota bacterium]